MAIINTSIKKDLLNTPVPNLFIDQYMPQSIPAYACIYIYTYKHCLDGTEPLTIKGIAETFNLLESDVIKAFQYWQEKNLVTLINEADGNLSINFLPINEEVKAPQKLQIVEREPLGKPPKYSPVELELYKTNYSEINDLFNGAEKILGKTLNAADLSTLYSFYDWLRFPIELILYLIEYCASNNHRRMRYIETVAVDWAENGIKTLDQAKEYVHIFNYDYREIMKALGISSRNPAPIEITYMEKWRSEYQFDLQIILEACDKTIMSAHNPEFKYVDKILRTWHEASVKTLDDIKKLDLTYKNEKEGAKKSRSKKSSIKAAEEKSKFANFDPHERNFAEIEKMEWEYLQKSLKGKDNGQ